MDYLLNRRSVREFDLNKKISYETLVELCKYGEAAPSARNQRSREYIVIDDKSVLDELSNTSKGSGVLKNCNTAIAVVGKESEGFAEDNMILFIDACVRENSRTKKLTEILLKKLDERGNSDNTKFLVIVKDIIANIKANGDKALIEFAKELK